MDSSTGYLVGVAMGVAVLFVGLFATLVGMGVLAAVNWTCSLVDSKTSRKASVPVSQREAGVRRVSRKRAGTAPRVPSAGKGTIATCSQGI